MSNLDKYRQYEAILDDIANQFCLSYFTDGLPSNLYSIAVNHQKYEYGYYIRKAEVEEVSYHFKGDQRKPYYNKRPTAKAVSEIKQLSETISIADLDKSNIYIHVRDGGTSWATSLDELESADVSIDEESMKPALKEKIDYYVENYLIKDGQFACAYCRKATDNDKKITRDIISRQYPNFRKSFDHCSEKCASHNQMSHEG